MKMADPQAADEARKRLRRLQNEATKKGLAVRKASGGFEIVHRERGAVMQFCRSLDAVEWWLAAH
jgi:hypothetical protein